ncbi:reverse transcriptase domain-containing protein [Halomonas sp.]|uniref:reverse transcriptase domain-containing protein n=1 Tax=Halomonas sp. TaxID=1486246 RepID=UPI00262A3268|nr:reverse transcriptase domain-containing protein [Halomonas sp.]
MRQAWSAAQARHAPGVPLSPLLANILLDDANRKLEPRGHCFCRYADDMQVYVRSRRAGERVMASMSDILESSLRLTVNRDKRAVGQSWHRGYLGYTLTRRKRPKVTLAKASLQRLIQRVRKLMARGLDDYRTWKSAGNVRGTWWNAGTSHMNQALPWKWFNQQARTPSHWWCKRTGEAPLPPTRYLTRHCFMDATLAVSHIDRKIRSFFL